MSSPDLHFEKLIEISSSITTIQLDLRYIRERIDEHKAEKDKEIAELEKNLKSVEARVEVLEKDFNKRIGLKEGLVWLIGLISGILGVIAGIFGQKIFR